MGARRWNRRDGGLRQGASRLSRKHGLVYEMMPLLWTLRAGLMLPVSFTPNGSLRFRWVSLPMVLTFAAWLVLTAFSYFLIRSHLDPVSEDGKHFHVWDLVMQYGGAVHACYILFIPFTSWFTARRSVAMVEQWNEVETLIRSLRGPPPLLALGLRRRAWLASLACVMIPLSFESVTTLTHFNDRWWKVPSMLHSFIYFMLASLFWNLSCRTLAFVVNQQAACMTKDFERLGIPGLRAHRKIWLGLSKTLHQLTAFWGRTQAALLGFLFVSFVAVSFILLHMITRRDMLNIAWWFIMLYVLIFWAIITVCNSSQIVTDAMRASARKKLLYMSLSVRDPETSAEIIRFLYDIRMECPQVSLCRLTVLRRSSILSLFALANTYIFVLSQFAISVEQAESNFTEDPALLLMEAEREH